MKDTVNYTIGEVLYEALTVKDNVMRYDVDKDASVRAGSILKPQTVISTNSQPQNSRAPSTIST